MTSLIIFGIAILIGLVSFLRRSKRTSNGETNHSKGSNIHNPKILLLQIGTLNQSQLDADLTIYCDYYTNVTTKTVNNLKEFIDFISNASFDLFHLFVNIDKDGNIIDGSDKITVGKIISVIQARNAKYIFFANDSPSDSYTNGSKGLKHTTNIVMTLERKGNNFSEFFKKVFSKVSKGQTLPVAWNEIAPQIPGVEHDNTPSCMAVMGAGSVILRGDK